MSAEESWDRGEGASGDPLRCGERLAELTTLFVFGRVRCRACVAACKWLPV